MRPRKKDLRCTKQTKRKKYYRSPICKKNKSRRKWCTVPHTPYDVQLDILQEDSYDKKSQHSEDTKHWKVMPKDSCEVYRARRKRQQTDMSARPNQNIKENLIETQMEEN